MKIVANDDGTVKLNIAFCNPKGEAQDPNNCDFDLHYSKVTVKDIKLNLGARLRKALNDYVQENRTVCRISAGLRAMSINNTTDKGWIDLTTSNKDKTVKEILNMLEWKTADTGKLYVHFG